MITKPNNSSSAYKNKKPGSSSSKNKSKSTNKNKKRRSFDTASQNEDEERVMGQVIDALPDTHFRVRTEKGDMIAYMGGKMRVFKIKILVGDRVELLLDEYGGKARLIKRL